MEEASAPSQLLAGSDTSLVTGFLAGKRLLFVGQAPGMESAMRVLCGRGALLDHVLYSDGSDWHADLHTSDALVMAAPPEWELIEPIQPGVLSSWGKPALILGPQTLLTRLAQVRMPGLREYMIVPPGEEYLIWRLTLLLLRSGKFKVGEPPNAVRQIPEVLVADGDPTARNLVSTLLGRYRMKPAMAQDGEQACALIRSQIPDAVILEAELPGMDGFQLLSIIRQDPALSHIKVLFLTKRATEADKLQAFALGADDYITKPFSPMELTARLKRLLRASS